MIKVNQFTHDDWINALLVFAWAAFGMADIIHRYQANTPFDRVIVRLYHKFMRTLKGFDGGFWA